MYHQRQPFPAMKLVAKVVEKPATAPGKIAFLNVHAAVNTIMKRMGLISLHESDVPTNVRVAEWDNEGKRVHIRRANRGNKIDYLSLDPELVPFVLSSMEIDHLDKEHRLKIPNRASIASPEGTQLWIIQQKDGDPLELSRYKRFLIGEESAKFNGELTFVSCTEYNGE